MSANRQLVGIDTGIDAARRGDRAALAAWLQAGHNPNQHDAAGWTPLLWAAARGHAEAVVLLLDHPAAPADPAFGHRDSQALAIHLAGHSGSARTAEVILERRPAHLDAVWDLNGHTVLLQAVFYGHLELARLVLQRGADTAITTARGLGPMELAAQFQNQAMMDLIRPFDRPAEAKAAYYRSYLQRIAPDIPPAERPAQALADELVAAIENGIKQVLQDRATVGSVLAAVRELVEQRGADVNRLGGALQQPPLIVAVTGHNGLPPKAAVAQLRREVAELLLAHGADPTRHEMHPMGAQTIIRGAVFNHLDILRSCARVLTPQRLADAINEIPVVNGLTAMHDTVLRATMVAPDRFGGYLEQARWFVANGGRVDIEDFAGLTQRNYAERASNPEVRQRLLEVLDGRA